MTASRVWRAWSCTVRLVVDDDSAVDAAAQHLELLLDRVDRAASRFRADSDLSRVNARAGRPVPVSRELVGLLDPALAAAGTTDGAVSPLLGMSLQAIGYDRDIAVIDPDGPPVDLVIPRATWRAIHLDRDHGIVTIPSGTALDLGATAKALTADRAAHDIAATFGTAVLVELGGDLAVAGHRPGGWPIRITEREGDDGVLLVVHHGGVATSTTTVRRWQRGGQLVHHIVDPATGAPAAGRWRTVTVAAASAFDANVASTAAIVGGDAARAWLDGCGLAARLVDVRGDVVLTERWPVPVRAGS